MEPTNEAKLSKGRGKRQLCREVAPGKMDVEAILDTCMGSVAPE